MTGNYWEISARKNKKIKTSPDKNLDCLETFYIKKYLKKHYLALDIGSGDGRATKEFARHVKHVDALEPSETLFNIAKKQKAKNIDWKNGSALEIDKIYKGRNFNVFITKRVLINLKNRREQKKLINLISRMSRPGDLYLLSEGFTDTFKNLQKLRKDFGLKQFGIVDFNCYLDRNWFLGLVGNDFKILEQNNFGIYYFLSHLIHPMLISPKEPIHQAKINQIAAKIALGKKWLEEFGYTNFYALQRK